MNKYAYPWDDEIMAEVRSRKAHVLQEHGGWEGYCKYLDTIKPQLEKEGWNIVNPDEVYKQNLRRQMVEKII
jgi:hypothetical protein